MTITTHKSFCRFCHANCAMLVDVEDGVPVAVRGDPDDPMFGGYTCIKGRQLAEAHTHPDRLTGSLRRADAGFEPVASAAALDEIAERLRAIVDEHGPAAVAVYCGTYAFQNSAALFTAAGFLAGLGSHQFYTSVTLDQPAKVYTTRRMGQWGAGWQSFSTADVAMFIGNNPVTSHYAPVGGLPPFSPSRRLRDALDRGLKLIVVDPRLSDVAKLAHLHLQVKPGEDATLLAGIINIVIAEGLYDHAFCQRHVGDLPELARAVVDFTPAFVAARAGVPAADVIAAARTFARGSRGVAVTGTGPEMSGRGTLVETLVSALNIICGRVAREGEVAPVPRVFTAAAPRRAEVTPPAKPWGEGFPRSRFRGLTMLGMEMPCNVLADEILTPGDGQIRALLCIGGNPENAFPNQEKIARALDDLDLLVAVDVRLSATARRAHYVLAPTMCLERDDITNLSEWWYEVPYARYTEAVVPARGDQLDEWEIMWELARRLGTPLPLAGGPAPMDVKPTKTEILDLICAGSLVAPSRAKEDTRDGAHIYSELAPLVEPGEGQGRFVLTPDRVADELRELREAEPPAGFSHLLVSRRTRHAFNSTGRDLPKLRARNQGTNHAHMHPDDIAALSLGNGDIVEISSAHGRIFGVLKSSPEMRRGVVSMAHGWGSASAGLDSVRDGGASTNRLVADDVGYDPITGQAQQSAIPVNLRPAPAA